MEMENLKNLRCLQTKGMGCMFHLIGTIAWVFDACVMLCNVMRACCSSLVSSASVEWGDIRPRQQYPCQSVAFSSLKQVNIYPCAALYMSILNILLTPLLDKTLFL